MSALPSFPIPANNPVNQPQQVPRQKLPCLIADASINFACDKSFFDQGSLTRHMLLKHGALIKWHHCNFGECTERPADYKGSWTKHWNKMVCHPDSRDRIDSHHVHITSTRRCHPICPSFGTCLYTGAQILRPQHFKLPQVPAIQAAQGPDVESCDHCTRLAASQNNGHNAAGIPQMTPSNTTFPPLPLLFGALPAFGNLQINSSLNDSNDIEMLGNDIEMAEPEQEITKMLPQVDEDTEMTGYADAEKLQTGFNPLQSRSRSVAPPTTFLSLPLEVRERIIEKVVVPKRYLPGWMLKKEWEQTDYDVPDLINIAPSILDYSSRAVNLDEISTTPLPGIIPSPGDLRSQYYRTPNIGCCTQLRSEVFKLLSRQYFILRLRVSYHHPDNDSFWFQHLLSNMGFSILNPVFENDPSLESQIACEMSMDIRGGSDYQDYHTRLDSPISSMAPLPTCPTTSITVFYDRQSFRNLIVHAQGDLFATVTKVRLDFSISRFAPAHQHIATMMAQNVGYFRNLDSLAIRGSPLGHELESKLAVITKKVSDDRYPDLDCLDQIIFDAKGFLSAKGYMDAIATADLGLELCHVGEFPENLPMEGKNLYKSRYMELRLVASEAYMSISTSVSDDARREEILSIVIEHCTDILNSGFLSRKQRSRAHFQRYRAICEVAELCRKRDNEDIGSIHFEDAMRDLLLTQHVSKPGETLHTIASDEVESWERHGIEQETFEDVCMTLQLPSWKEWRGDRRAFMQSVTKIERQRVQELANQRQDDGDGDDELFYGSKGYDDADWDNSSIEAAKIQLDERVSRPDRDGERKVGDYSDAESE